MTAPTNSFGVTREAWLDLLHEAERYFTDQADRFKAQASAAPPWSEHRIELWRLHDAFARWSEAIRQAAEELAGGQDEAAAP